jgi:hypothetical protein
VSRAPKKSRRWRSKRDGFPESYVELHRRERLGHLKVLGASTLLMIIAYFWVDSPLVLSVLGAVWVLVAITFISSRHPSDASLKLFFPQKMQGACGSYPAMFRNYRHLEGVFGEDADCDRFLFLYRHGLVVPWGDGSSQGLTRFLGRIADHPELLTAENGFIDIEDLRREARAILHDAGVAQAKGSGFVLVMVSGLNGMEETNGFLCYR